MRRIIPVLVVCLVLTACGGATPAVRAPVAPPMVTQTAGATNTVRVIATVAAATSTPIPATSTPTSTVARPTDTPQPTATTKPTDAPKSTDTAQPTSAPQPTATTKPTDAPKSTDTVQPTNTKPANTVVPTPSPKIEVTASVSNDKPAQNSDVTVRGKITVNGVGIGDVPMRAIWRYKSTAPTCDGVSNNDGVASCSRAIGTATKGYKVVVEVTFTYQGKQYKAQTDFTPQ
jgi:hypothetical protein